MQSRRTVLILAGGKGQRFQSRDKCFIILKKKPLIEHAIDNLSTLADEIIVAARARDEQQWLSGLVGSDKYKNTLPNEILLVFDSDSAFSLDGFGILAGVLSGLERASSPYSLIIGCDMPFVNKNAARFLFEIAEHGDYDAVVPIWENRMAEPLHAVYKREPMLALVKAAIRRGEKRMFTVLSRLKNLNYIPVERLRCFDPELKTFKNINTPEELENAQI